MPPFKSIMRDEWLAKWPFFRDHSSFARGSSFFCLAEAECSHALLNLIFHSNPSHPSSAPPFRDRGRDKEGTDSGARWSKGKYGERVIVSLRGLQKCKHKKGLLNEMKCTNCIPMFDNNLRQGFDVVLMSITC